MRNNHVLHVVVPEAKLDKLLEQPRADDLEFTSKDTTSVDVAVVSGQLKSVTWLMITIGRTWYKARSTR